MRIVKNILVYLSILLSFSAVGQELPFFSNYTINPLVYNPASAGEKDEVQTFLHHRTQWSGFKGSPVSHLFTITAPVTNINSGIGLSLQNDQRGLFNTLTGSAKYAYHAKLNQKSTLSFGVGLDIQNRTFRIGESTVRDTEDPLINSGSTSETFFDASFGVKYNLSDKLIVGFSVPQILEANGGTDDSFVKNARYYMGQASYLFNVSSSGKLKVQPVVLARYSKTIPLQYDINALVHYKDLFLIGAGYRAGYAVNLHAGATLKNFQVRYVYDFATVNSNLNAGLSHEITLGYTFNTTSSKPEVHHFEEEETEEEPLSEDKIRAILNLLIDDFFESGNNNPEELKKIELLRETIFKLLESMENN